MKSEAFNEDLIGIPLDIYIPELKLAFMFCSRESGKQNNVKAVMEDLCKRRGILCKSIEFGWDMEHLCVSIKQGFAERHTYICSDNQKDLEQARAKYEKWRGW